MKEISPKQRAFADNYLLTLNATKSAIKVGYSEKWAASNIDKLLKNTEIKKYLKEQQEILLKENTGDKYKIIKVLQTMAFGKDNADYIRMNALKLLMKHYGMLEPDIAVNINNTVNLTVNKYEDNY